MKLAQPGEFSDRRLLPVVPVVPYRHGGDGSSVGTGNSFGPVSSTETQPSSLATSQSRSKLHFSPLPVKHYVSTMAVSLAADGKSLVK